MQIYVDSEELRKCSQEIDLLAAELEDILHSIDTLVITLNDYWRGESKEIYELKIFDLEQRYRLLMNWFRDFSNIIEKCTERYERSESELVSTINLT